MSLAMTSKPPARAAVDSARAGPEATNRAERQSDDGKVALADTARETR